MLKKVALVFGIVFILIGLLGFVPGITTNDSNGMPMLFGLFTVGVMHNIVHLLSGIVALFCATSERAAKLFLQIFGVIYALVTIIGFVQGTTVLGLFDVNMADNWLHLVFALVLLGTGFFVKSATATTPPTTPVM